MAVAESLAASALVLFIALAACHRDPIPSQRTEACTATCASLACTNSSLEPDVIDRCEAYCGDKFEASTEQGPGCEDAYEEAMLCLADLGCAGFGSWYAMEQSAGCPWARNRVQSACDGIYLEPEVLPP